MQFKFKVLQVTAVAHNDSPRKEPTHIQVGLQTDDGDNQMNLTVPISEAERFVVGSNILFTVNGGTH